MLDFIKIRFTIYIVINKIINIFSEKQEEGKKHKYE